MKNFTLPFPFSSCKKLEDRSIPIIAYCGVSKEILLLSAKSLKNKISVTDNLINETKNILKGSNNDSYCDEKIRINKVVLNGLMQQPNANIKRINSRFSRSAKTCSEEQRLELEFQMKMTNSVQSIIKQSLLNIQNKLKSKYFFGSVLNMMKFLTDIE